MAQITFRQRLRSLLKAFTMRFPGSGGSGWGAWSGRWSDTPNLNLLLPGAGYDYETAAGDMWRNSAVAACLAWIQWAFPEPRLMVQQPGDEGWANPEEVPEHPLVTLIDAPNGFFSDDLLWGATLISYLVDGNAYWLKVRTAAGKPVELWYVPHWMMEPRWPRDGSEFITHYDYILPGGPQRVEPADVVHFRDGVDPRNIRKGMGALKAVLREVATDNECNSYSAALMRNFGVPGVMITPADSTVVVNQDFSDKLRQLWTATTTGELRGRPIVPTIPLKLDKLAWSPEEMIIDRLQRVPEARICAALGVPAMMIGLTVGDQQRTYSNMAEARESFMENRIVPLQRSLAKVLQRHLLPDVSDAEDERVVWDYSQVRILQEDQDKLHKRVALDYQAGVITRADARRALGYQVADGDEVYFVAPQGGQATMPGEQVV